jgi:hypothetical protein
MYYNSTSNRYEFCNGSAWGNIGLAAGDATVFTGKITFGTAADAADAIWFPPDGTIVAEGATANDFETSLAFTDPTADRTITFPDGTGTVMVDFSQTFAGAFTWDGAQSFNAASAMNANKPFTLNTTGAWPGLIYATALTPDSGGFFVGAVGTFDFNNGPCATSACTDPTLILHSANQSTTEWLAFWHNQTNAVIQSGTGVITLISEGTADDYETTVTFADTTASDKTITFPNTTGTVVTTAGDTFTGSVNFLFAGFSSASVQYGAWFESLANTESVIQKATAATPDSLYIGVGTTSFGAHLIETTDRTYDFNNGPCGTSACTNPTLSIHSAAQDTTNWLSLAHDQTNAHISTGAGGVLGLAYAVEANTGAKTPTLGGEGDEKRELYTNTGDGDGSSVTMPNDPTAGTVFRVAATVAQTITIAPGTGESLYYEGDQCVANLTSATIGTMVEIVAATGGNGAIWIADGGGWTCNDA